MVLNTNLIFLIGLLLALIGTLLVITMMKNLIQYYQMEVIE